METGSDRAIARRETLRRALVSESPGSTGNRSGQRLPPGRRRNRRTATSFKDILHLDEGQRSEVLADALARRAARRAEVVDVRKRLLGGRTVTTAEAIRLLRQAGPQHFDAAWFQRKRIPLVGHRSYYCDPKSGSKLPGYRPRARVVLEWDGQQIVAAPPKGTVTWPDSDCMHRRADALPPIADNTILGEIQKIAGQLVKSYDWELEDAAMFILTGTAPPMPAIAVREPASLSGFRGDHFHSLITLRIEPWVSPESVARAYQRLQHRFTEKQARRLDRKSLTLFEFVETWIERERGVLWTEVLSRQRRGVGQQAVPWATIAKHWNEEYGERFGAYTGRDLSRNFRRVYDAIVWPRFVPSGVRVVRRPKAARAGQTKREMD